MPHKTKMAILLLLLLMPHKTKMAILLFLLLPKTKIVLLLPKGRWTSCCCPK